VSGDIEQIALLMFASTRNGKTVGGGRVMLVNEFLADDLRGSLFQASGQASRSRKLPPFVRFSLSQRFGRNCDRS
jgi:hypothetical protein